MPLDSDVALVGTGLAPLVAAGVLAAEGRSVLLINPDGDFFREDSELALDPLWPVSAESLSPERLARSSPESAIQELRPGFPGAVELWPEPRGAYHDPMAPYVRSRSRLWLRPSSHVSRTTRLQEWERIEDMYVESSDAGMNPQVLEGLAALKRFPGVSGRALRTAADQDSEFKGVLLPKICDVDVSRYRAGLLEFIRERVGPQRIVCGASQLELIPEGVRFHAGGMPKTARLRAGLLAFWTPALTSWVVTQAKQYESPIARPRGARLWEEWSLISREPLDTAVVGAYENMSIWADVEGSPESVIGGSTHLQVLRGGPLVELESFGPASSHFSLNWASSESFRSLSRLFHEFLHWERFSVRSLRTRAILEWDRPRADLLSWPLSRGMPGRGAWVVGGCDGLIVDVVRAARRACALLEAEVA